MSNYIHFSKDVDLWEPSTQMVWGSHDICSPLLQFQLRETIITELYALSQAGAWGKVENPSMIWHFFLIALDKTTKGQRVFCLVAVCTHQHQAHHHSHGDAACKLALLINIGSDWTYAFALHSEAILHTPLSSKGHISVMIDGMPSMNACGCLSQLEVCKLLQCGDQVVCPKGLIGELEPMRFTLANMPMSHCTYGSTSPAWSQEMRCPSPQSPYILNATFLHASHHEVSLWGSYQHDCRATRTSVTSHAQHFWPSPRAYHPKEVTIRHPWVPTYFWGGAFPGNDPCTSMITPALSVSPAPKTIQVASVFPVHQPKTSLWPKPAAFLEELFWLEEKLTIALECLLTMRAILNLRQWELDLQVELSRCLNDTQFKKAMKEVMACCSTAGATLKEAYKSNVMVLEQEAKVEEGRECQAFFWRFLTSHAGMPARGSVNLHVSPPATHSWCATSCLYRNDNCGSATSCGGHNGYTQGHHCRAWDCSSTIRW